MKSPFTGQEMTIHKELRTMSFRKEEFQIVFHTYKCEETGEQFEDELFSQLNYNQLVNQYREKYTIPFPEQIIAIREKYEVSAVKMSVILGFGANGYRLYEGGEVPSQSNARLIQVVDDPQEFRKFVEVCFDLDRSLKEKIFRKIDHLLEVQREASFEKQVENYLFEGGKPGRLTGYKKPNLEKFSEMVVYFTETLQPYKTKMNKLLFYSDFHMHKQYAFSISGVPYRAIDMGPVPNNFNSIFEYLSNNNKVDIQNFNFPDGGTGEQFKPNGKSAFRSELFSKEELSILSKVAERFKKTSTNEIIDISHKEKAWIENKENKKLIDYTYSFDLIGLSDY
ncbi:MAG: DUF4065 domain-containing protein [Bacteroidia bacterium]|nr:DUF4065 domain-containing protein [Bacteroidia bacterium]